ncbi:MAG: flagellar basal body-associated FliL family protein [Maritimibacter sp.]|nr:flagellar basal body-associated FliL family protein [Maritimibacter sp.]
MADDATPDTEGTEEAPKKKSRLGLLIGLVLALGFGGGGFFAVYSGLILGPDPAADAGHGAAESAVEALAPVSFVALEPLVVSIGTGSTARHLRFRAELEVNPGAEADVTKLTPRVMDVLNSYLRAVAVSDLEDPSALVSLRAQMLRRIQLVTGEGRVRDLLIMEFVLS